LRSRPKKSGSALPWFLCGVTLLLVAAGGAGFWLTRPGPAKPTDDAQRKRDDRPNQTVLGNNSDRDRSDRVNPGDKPDRTDPGEKTQPPPPKTYKNALGIEFVLIPKGRSWLGGGGGKPGDKEVEMPHDFYLGRYLVTQEEWQKVMGSNPSYFSRTGGGRDAVNGVPDEELKRFPVDNVSWDDAQAFLAELNKRTKESGWVYRLPTEAEWEYACRGGPLTDKRDSAFHFYFDKPTNQVLPEQANFHLNRTCKVGSYAPNRLGLYDMHGNVWEWCDDRVVDARGLLHQAPGDSLRVERGGCWHDGPGSPFRCTSARISFPASRRNNDHGFRVARVPIGKENK
jgi:formylglycine-generating enzyme required for sulfatase activity